MGGGAGGLEVDGENKNGSGAVEGEEIGGAADGSIPIALHGAKGRLGSLIVQEIELEKHAGASCSGRILSLLYKIGRKDLDTFIRDFASRVAVVIDVTLPAGTMALVQALMARAASGCRNPALVVGTTGLTAEEIRTLKAYTTAGECPYHPNG